MDLDAGTSTWFTSWSEYGAFGPIETLKGAKCREGGQVNLPVADTSWKAQVPLHFAGITFTQWPSYEELVGRLTRALPRELLQPAERSPELEHRQGRDRRFAPSERS